MTTPRLLRTTIATPRWRDGHGPTAARTTETSENYNVHRCSRTNESTRFSVRGVWLRGGSSRAYCGDSTKARTHGVYMRACACERTCISSFNANARHRTPSAVSYSLVIRRLPSQTLARGPTHVLHPASSKIRRREDCTPHVLRDQLGVSFPIRTRPHARQRRGKIVSSSGGSSPHHQREDIHPKPSPHQARQGVVNAAYCARSSSIASQNIDAHPHPASSKTTPRGHCAELGTPTCRSFPFSASPRLHH
jgi:hypothetical protein